MWEVPSGRAVETLPCTLTGTKIHYSGPLDLVITSIGRVATAFCSACYSHDLLWVEKALSTLGLMANTYFNVQEFYDTSKGSLRSGV